MKDKLKQVIDKALKDNNGMVVLAIDGMSASGKSTLAQEVADKYGGSVVHMDDFFLPAELRTNKRLETPGGNIHYERFKEEVLPGIADHRSFEYGIFDCRNMRVCGIRKITIKKEACASFFYRKNSLNIPSFCVIMCIWIK